MNTPNRWILPSLVFAVAGSLCADTTGRISGTVTSTDGKPVVGAVLVLSRLDITWKKELKTDQKGIFFQVGLDPKEFDLTVTAAGYVPYKETLKIPLGETLPRKIVLQTVSQMAGSATGIPAAEVSSIKAENVATSAYNDAVGFYSAKEFQQALAPSELAYKSFKEAFEQTKDDTVKDEIAEKFDKANFLLGMVSAKVGKHDQAKDLLSKHLEKKPKDGVALQTLLNLSRETKDKAGESKYQALLDEMEGPKPEIAYNEGVVALNGGHFKAAKESALKALKVKADYADAYYILGIAEFGLNNLKAAKESLKKYLDMAPTGSKAAEVKEMLRSL